MKKLKVTALIIRFTFRFALAILLMIWNMLVFSFGLLGDASDEDESSEDTEPYYNYHTGEIDAVKYWNGLYDEDQ